MVWYHSFPLELKDFENFAFVSILHRYRFPSNMAQIAEYLKKRDLERQRALVFDASGLPVMNAAAIKLSCLEHDGYETPHLNEKLYLHFRGYRKIENLEDYANVKTLFLESNGLKKIENISHLTGMRCLYLHQNLIDTMEGLEGLSELATVNLSQNRVKSVTGLETLQNLGTLNLAKNCLSTTEDLEGLLKCPSITNLDLSGNSLEDPEIVEKVLKKLPKLSALYLKGNPVVRKIKHYRKTLLNAMPNLAYLDDRPVFELEKVAVKAWAEGGVEAERAARKAFQTNKVEKDRESMRSFRRWKDERRAARQAEIEKCKKEGRAVPQPKKYVSYREMADSEMDEADRMRAALAKAEKNVGANDIKALGREYWKNEGVPVFDENGRRVEEAADAQPAAPEPAVEIAVQEEAAPAPAPPPAPSTKAAAKPPVPPTSPITTQKTAPADEEEKKASAAEEEIDADRQNRVAESLRMYQQQRQQAASKQQKLDRAETVGRRGGNPFLRPNKYGNSGAILSKMVEEERGLTPEEREKLEKRVQEAEEEEDNYRSARSQMKNQARNMSTRKKGQGWNNVADEKLQALVIECVFDFDTVAKKLGRSPEECRLRFALLDKRSRHGPMFPSSRSTSSGKNVGAQKSTSARRAEIPASRTTTASKKPTFYPPRSTSTSDPFASFAAASSGVSSVTVDFAKLPSMSVSDGEDSDENDSDDPGMFQNAVRSSDIHRQVFGDAASAGGASSSAQTDVDGLD